MECTWTRFARRTITSGGRLKMKFTTCTPGVKESVKKIGRLLNPSINCRSRRCPLAVYQIINRRSAVQRETTAACLSAEYDVLFITAIIIGSRDRVRV